MPVNDGQERVTAFLFNLQLFAEGEGAEDAEAGTETQGTEPNTDPLETLYEMKPIDGFETEDAGESEPKEVESDNAGQVEVENPDEDTPPGNDEKGNAKWAEMRRKAEQADKLEAELARRDQEIAKRFGDKNINTFDEMVKGWDNAQRQQAQAQSQDQVTAFFQQRYQQRVDALVADGYDEGLADQLARMQTDQEYFQWERQNERTTQQQQAQQQAQETQRKQNEDAVMKLTMEQYGELKKDYPDLLPADCQDFHSLVEQLNPKVVEKMANDRMMLSDAFKLVNLDEIVSRASKRGAQQTLNSVNGRAHVKPSGGASEVETIAIPEETLKMYKQLNPGRTHKEYLEHYRRSLKG